MAPHSGTIRLVAVLSALYLTLFLSALDFSVVTTALPKIAHDFSSAAGFIWIGAAYLLTSAVSSPIWAKASDIWGRKPVLLIAIVVFAASSAVCASSKNVAVMIAGRALQGAATGGIIVLVNVCISDLFILRHRGLYLGLTGMVWGVASGVGPLTGGALAEYASWRWAWWINLPISAAAFLVLLAFLKLDSAGVSLLDGVKTMDWLGSAAIVGMTVMVMLGLDLGGVVTPWSSPKIICLLVAGLFVGVLFVLWEVKSAKFPLIPAQVVKDWSNVAVLAVCFLHGFVNMSSWYFLPLYFQAVRGASPTRSGLLIIPLVAVQAFVGVAAGFLMNMTGQRLSLIYVGLLLMTVGFGLFALLTPSIALSKIIALEMVAGTGVGLVFQAPLLALHARLHPQHLAAGTALFGFVRSISTTISVVIGSVVFQSGMSRRTRKLTGTLPADLLTKFSGNSAFVNVALISGLNESQKVAIKTAYAESLRDMWILYACAAAFGLLSSFAIKAKVSPPELEHGKPPTPVPQPASMTQTDIELEAQPAAHSQGGFEMPETSLV